LSEEDQLQLQMLLDRIAAQDPEGASFTQFLESVKPLLSSSPALFHALVDALGKLANPAAVAALQALQEIPADKPLRRAVKAALFRLRRQGLLAEEETAEPRVLVPRPAERQPQAWAAMPEALGSQAVVVKLPDPEGGFFLTLAVMDPDRGFEDFSVLKTSHKELRSLLKEMEERGPSKLIEIPMAHLRYLFEEMTKIHQEQHLPLPNESALLTKYLSSWAAAATQPYVYELVKTEEVAGNLMLLRSSDSLLELPVLDSWRLPPETVQPFVQKMKELTESRLVISEAMQLDRMEQIIREATAEIFSEKVRRRYRRIMEECSLLLCLEESKEEAKRALAVAVDLQAEVSLLTENTFLLGLVRRSIGADVIQDFEAQKEGAERTTDSGLIIPGR